ncbi:Apc13 domain protein [Talaromyces islandicus]|uniref:Apc13 domain protein n=1 Tax=Talaromyces islandicus TaxID=28573 RepID=A0A0U1LMV8_TALIS|nr:Apc13 domain protein [Talaromyces islandicus]
MHHPRLADLFEDFTRPHTSIYSNLASSQHHAASTTTGPGGVTVTYGAAGNSAISVPSFLPIEDIYVPPQYQPINPEDEDDVVPDQHAAFGIARAMDSVGRRAEPVWRDLGLTELGMQVIGAGGGGGVSTTAGVAGSGQLGDQVPSAASRLRLRETGVLMGGRRVSTMR